MNESCGGAIPTSASSRSMANNSDTKSDCRVPTMRDDMDEEDEDDDDDDDDEDDDEAEGGEELGRIAVAVAVAPESMPAFSCESPPWRLRKIRKNPKHGTEHEYE